MRPKLLAFIVQVWQGDGMKKKDFDRLTKANRFKPITTEACYLVLFENLSGYAAAQATGLAESTISRALKKLERGLCPHCGQPLKE